MPSDVTRTMQQNLDRIAALLAEQDPQNAARAGRAAETVPPAAQSAAPPVGDPTLPELPAPAGPLSLDTLMKAIGNDVRKNSVHSGLDAIKAKGEEQERIGREQLEKMQEQLDKIEKQKHLSWWQKAFSIVGCVVGALVAAATIAAGVLTANPLLIVAGAMAALLTVNAVTEMASGGKHGLAAWVADVAKAAGASEKTAQIIGFAYQMSVTVATAVMTFGAGAGNVAAQAATKAVLWGSRAINTTSGLLTATQGSLGVASAAYGYEAAEAGVSRKQMQAILERLRESIAAEREILEAEVRRSNALTEQVMDIVKSCTHTQQAISSANPTLA